MLMFKESGTVESEGTTRKQRFADQLARASWGEVLVSLLEGVVPASLPSPEPAFSDACSFQSDAWFHALIGKDRLPTLLEELNTAPAA